MYIIEKLLIIMKRLSIFLCLLTLVSAASARTFRHPGVLHSAESLERIRRLACERVEPAVGSYDKLLADPKASFHYAMQGPFADIARAGTFAYTKRPCEEDFNAAYYNALMWIATRDVRHADKALEIIRAYAATLERIHQPDAPLCAALQGFMLLNAAEIIRYTCTAPNAANGWCEADTQATERMFRRAFLPVLTEFFAAKPYTNGNWGIAAIKMQIGLGVFLDDERLYDEAIDRYLHSRGDNGSLPDYIAPSGQLQESGRDQAHCMLGIGCLAEIAEVAWQQGDDLYGALDNRLMKGCEYLSASNLGYEVPFFTWQDHTGKYSAWHTLGQAGMGAFRAVFELPYNHYTERCGMEMPRTRQVIERIRPEGAGWTCDNPGFGTWLFYLGDGEQPLPAGCIDEEPLRRSGGWNFATASQRLNSEGQPELVSSGAACSRKNLLYDASKYPWIAVKVPHMPRRHERRWLTLSCDVMSAPEYWTFDERAAVRIGDTWFFRVEGARSNNGTRFAEQPVRTTLLLDFGQTGDQGVVVERIRSVASPETR